MSMIRQYRDELLKILDQAYSTQEEALERAAGALADALARGGTVYTFGTGHGHLLALELFYRAGGLARVCPILDARLMLHVSASASTDWERRSGLAGELLERHPVSARDVLIVCSNSGRNAVPVELASGARARGATVIALTSLRHTRAVAARNPLGLRLFETADILLDNGGELGDAVCTMASGHRAGPTSTAVGAALLQAVVCRAVEQLEARRVDPECFVSSNIDGGDERNRDLIARYKPLSPAL